MTAEVLGVYFTPPANAAAAIVKAIDDSEREVLVQAYGFTHNAIAQALVRAHQRGVVVRVLLDRKSQGSNRYVMHVLTDAEHGLFPKAREIRFDCSCPDHADMCKHVSAVLYGPLDHPQIVLRQQPREELVGDLARLLVAAPGVRVAANRRNRQRDDMR